MNKNHYCIIMAGGIGSRFWPLSRNSKPKQFLDILGTGKSFLQQTFERFAKVISPDNILIVTSSQYKQLVKEQLPLVLDDNILLEPLRRNTAPCIAYATYKLLQKNENASVVVSPSDHLILNDDIFLDTICNALDYADKNNYLMTLGITPTRPETAYGYIQAAINKQIDINGHIGYEVKTFTEKPNSDLAKVFMESGEFMWNSGIFIWNLNTIKLEIESFLPTISNLFEKGDKIYYTKGEEEFISKVYEECTGISIEYGVMEKTDKALVYPVSFGWSDLGIWESLYANAAKDSSANMLRVENMLIGDTSNTIIISEEKDKLVVVKNLDNFMVINTDDVLMICPRDEAAFKSIIADVPLKDFNKFQ